MKENIFTRYTFLGLILCVLPLLIVLRILSLQINPAERDFYEETFRNREKEWINLTPLRGLILDRNGQQLANNQKTYEIGVDLTLLKDSAPIAEALSRTLGLDYAEIEAQIQLGISKKLQNVVITDYVTKEEIQSLIDYLADVEDSNDNKKQINLRALVYADHFKRNYPNNETGSIIIGYEGWKDKITSLTGIQGIEEYYDEVLAGKSLVDPSERNPINVSDRNISDNPTVITTIDINIQAMLEEIVDREVKTNRAKQGTIIVMDPKTGDILGMASSFRIDPNRYWESLRNLPDDLPYNPAIMLPYEPGSVQKPVTVAIGIESKSIPKDFTYVDTGVLHYAGVDIFNWDGGAYGPTNLVGCLQYSLNICMGTITTKHVPTDVLYNSLRSFGYGQLTGVDLANEVAGFLKTPNRGYWHESDRATNSFGQGFSATPIQMIMSMAAIANDGKMMTPRVVSIISRPDYTNVISPSEKARPISEDTADFVKELLTKSLPGEAESALPLGYTMAGKTGTGQIAVEGGYHLTLTNASFVGFGPVDDPKFIVYIWFQEPKSDIWGSTIAAPVFADVVQRLVVLMDIPPDDVRLSQAKP